MSYEQVLQKLKSNSKEVGEEAVRLLIKIADNVLKYPQNLKVRNLQKSNEVIRKKIIPARGAADCLKLMGFVESETSFTLPANYPVKRLEEAKNILSTFTMNNVKLTITAAETTEKTTNDTAEASTSKIHKDEDDLHFGGLRVTRFKLPKFTSTFSNPFLKRIESCFHDALKYDDKDVQKRAKALIPLTLLEMNAQENLRALQEHIKRNKLPDPETSVQDLLILELLHWFKNDFFTWVDTVPCEKCGSKTVMSCMSSDPKDFVYTDRVEVHKCEKCQHNSKFPRYNDLNILLETRRGRCGEWAQAFTLFCRALDWDARYVHDELDHVWTEVYSPTQNRWLHCDPCENVCDTPLMYESGWNKQLTYVIAYSPDEVQDVTWRYSSHHKEVLKRRRQCREEELVGALMKLRGERQKTYSLAKKNYLTWRVLRELVELMTERSPKETEQHGRLSGSLQWRQARGEMKQQEPNYVWKILDDHISSNNNSSLTIKYSAALDRYAYILADGTTRTVTGWNAGVLSYQNVFRKEEKDWKTAYLARNEGTDCGQVTWKYELENGNNKVIDRVTLKFAHKLYENGEVDVTLHSESDASGKLPKGVDDLETDAFSGSKCLVITASLRGGKGNVAWQHAQLFRQSLDDNNDFPFAVKFTFKNATK